MSLGVWLVKLSHLGLQREPAGQAGAGGATPQLSQPVSPLMLPRTTVLRAAR